MSKKSDIHQKSTIVTLTDGLTFTAASTITTLGSVQNTTEWHSFLLFLDVLFSAATTTGNDGRELQLKPEFSNDGGTTWFDYQNNFWGDLRFNDSQGNLNIKNCYEGECPGKTFRLGAVLTNGGYATTTVFTAVKAYVEFRY